MLKHLDSILAAAALTTASLAAGACDSGDGDTDATAGTTAGCPGTSAGCPGTSAGCPGTTAGCPGVDEAMILSEVMAYDAGKYTQVNLDRIDNTEHMAGKVDIWVPNDLVSDYYTIDPADYSSANVTFPAGALIIKKHYSDADAPEGWTVMYKADAGYNPDAGDWWWARVLEDGTFGEADGVPIKGIWQSCIGCHTPAGENADWARGIPADNHAG